MKKYFLIIFALFLSKQSVSQLYGPSEVCQYEQACYGGNNCSGAPFLYNCFFTVSGGNWVNANAGCDGSNGEITVLWHNAGGGHIHRWKRTLFGQVTYDHTYYQVNINPCVIGCVPNWQLTSLPLIPTIGHYMASDFVKL
ncbi:MAG: hypothetical protein IPP71_12390, partial [Bacteroidetes bacterium]|nr:hypothetical protein [Bacteroidota bacterium]